MGILDNSIYLIDDIPVVIVGIAEGYKGEAVVVYRGPKNKLGILSVNDFTTKAEKVEEFK